MEISIRMMDPCSPTLGLGWGRLEREGHLRNKSDKRHGGF